jgi:hypothetical protein
MAPKPTQRPVQQVLGLIRVNYQLNANICLFGSTCFGLYAHLQEQIEFLLQMRHMVPLLQPGVLRSVRAGGEMHSYNPKHVEPNKQIFALSW